MATDAEKLKQELAEAIVRLDVDTERYDARENAGYLLPWLQRLIARERAEARLEQHQKDFGPAHRCMQCAILEADIALLPEVKHE